MAEIPRAVLSESFEKQIDGRNLVAAVFTTFQFDPDFFEQQVLPVFLNVPTSHAEGIRRLQLEDALREVPKRIAVYYDQKQGLDAEAKPAKLDIARVPVMRRTGVFHPKNVFALLERPPAEGRGPGERALLIASMSANLTRAGWWENVEVCQIEEISDRTTTALKPGLVRFLRELERDCSAKVADGQESLREILDFLASTSKPAERPPGRGLDAQFFDGKKDLVDFLREAAGTALDGLNMEVISPYFDSGPSSRPLADLMDEFDPSEVRVFLPRKDTGEALCSKRFFEWVQRKSKVGWAGLPKEVIRGGKSAEVKSRGVHAKVYRFFQTSPRREYLFVGSVNLTTAAHRRGGNLESGIFVDVQPTRSPDWWMEIDRSKPTSFEPMGEDEGDASTAGSRLSLRYLWGAKRVEVYWDHDTTSPRLHLARSGVGLFDIEPIPVRQWKALSADCAAATEAALHSTSIFVVEGDRPEPAAVLVQEEGMAQRPSLLFDLTLEEILRYWSLLTVQQRAAFLEARAPADLLAGDGAELVATSLQPAGQDSFFDQFAGIFLSLGSLERLVCEAIAAGRLHAAEHLVFGQKYDSLGCFLAKVRQVTESAEGDPVSSYLMALCARQMIDELRRKNPDFFSERLEEFLRLESQLGVAAELRARLCSSGGPAMSGFLDWFDRWFLKRAKRVDPEGAS